MSTPNPVLVAGIATLAVTPGQPLPAGNAAQASISVSVTDSADRTYGTVFLTGAETPPWSFAATYASGPATAIAVALDTAGAVIGTPQNYAFTVTPAAPPATYTAPAGVSFVAAATSPATAAIHASLGK